MLMERGPVDPITEATFPAAGVRNTLAAEAASLAGRLHGLDAPLSNALSAIASASDAEIEHGGALDIAAAAAAHESQAAEFDAAIGAVAGNADAQASEFPGLAAESASDIANANVQEPDYVAHPPDPTWNIGNPGNDPIEQPAPGPGETVGDFINGLYQKYLRRDADLDGMNAWARLWPNSNAIEHGILFSEEYGSKVNALYEGYFGRGVQGGELAEHRAHFASLDDVEDDLRRRA